MPDVAPSGNYLSLFSGVAGLDCGLTIAFPDVRCIGYCERESTACEVLAARMEEGSIEPAPIFTDVRAFPCELYRGYVAGVAAGWPCPPVSVAGKRAGTEDARWLWPEVVRIIRETDARWFVGENVAGLLSANHGGALGDVMRDLAQIGFDAEFMCLRASDVGASHARLRWFCYAWKRTLAHKPGARRYGRPWTESLPDRSPLQATRPGDEYGDMAVAQVRRRGELRQPSERNGLTHWSDASLADPARHERDRPHGQAGQGRRVRQAGDELAYAQQVGRHSWVEYEPLADTGTGNGQLSVTGRGSQGRNGAGPAVAAVGNTENHKRLGGDSGAETGIGPEGLRRRGPAGSDGDVADANGLRLQGIWADSDTKGRQRPLERPAGLRNGAGLPIFAPGPGAAETWRRILTEYPWLAPAISQEEAESILRGEFDGRTDELDIGNRTDRLRAIGNMVCPIQAAFSLTVLARRAGLIDG